MSELAAQVSLIVTIEEHLRAGGLGSAVLEALNDTLGVVAPSVLRIGLPDAFPKEYGSQETMFETFGLTPVQIAKNVRDAVRPENCLQQTAGASM